ncbi:YaeQ family protein [Cellvibrio japonicus]|uniref:YaeQ family protein n=1 Tax=Cellvibrio japonicus (strain Ueda107) TaxID=498211 RepID=B3PEA3_CELJU|nr:YaeQ family protein [Cellvibrio japonicus]ACE85783.1 hypothetical protein CJA_1613 [Cellvibrio japonicus Ueda107]QEI12143.1 YaeQ family protein [Cellvibrio japonicus]QEI15717.1 YaeQ family protein [Cellvibrio japonicus]QEI19295.1 YaeQ family protein [Cellvibrio japonicus]
MAEKATIYKANIQLADMDRQVYGDYSLTIALHPSETHERMLVRILAFCYCAAENLVFTRGLSSVDEPDLWRKHDDGRILEWIEVGQPSVERLKKASSQAESVKVFAYGRGLDIWWKNNISAIASLPKVQVQCFGTGELQAACAGVEKTMNLSVSITENMVYLSTAEGNTYTLGLREMRDL